MSHHGPGPFCKWHFAIRGALMRCRPIYNGFCGGLVWGEPARVIANFFIVLQLYCTGLFATPKAGVAYNLKLHLPIVALCFHQIGKQLAAGFAFIVKSAGGAKFARRTDKQTGRQFITFFKRTPSIKHAADKANGLQLHFCEKTSEFARINTFV
nr:hypothetical protein [Maritalea myrionectae]